MDEVKDTLGSVAHPYLERVIERVMRHLADYRPIEALIRDLSPEAVNTLHGIIPGIGGFLMSKVPDSAFKSMESAMYVRSLALEAIKKMADVIKEKKDATDEDLTKAVEEAIKEVEGRKVIVDPFRQFHLPDCASLMHLNKRQMNDSTLKKAMDQGLNASPCCHPQVQKELNKAGDAKEKKSRKNASPFDIIGSMDPKEQRKFKKWLKGLSEDERKRVVEDLHELDSQEEFVGFMSLDPEMRLEMLPLLENRNMKHGFKRFLGIVGHLVKVGYEGVVTNAKRLWEACREFDESLAPKVQDLKDNWDKPRKPAKTVKWSLRKMLRLI